MLARFFGHPLEAGGSITNLNDLQSRLVQHILIYTLLISGFALWTTLPQQPFPMEAAIFWAVVFAASVLTLWTERCRSKLGRHLFIWGAIATVLLATYLFPSNWVPFTSLLIVFCSGVVLPPAQIVVFASVLLEAFWLNLIHDRDYDLASIALMLAFGIGTAWLVTRTLYTALVWAWNMQQRGDKLLEAVRRHRSELVQALRSLEHTNRVLVRTHNELLVARQQAETARRLKEQFAANISHELRTPLNLILGFSEIMYLSPEVYGEVTWPQALRRDVYQIYRSSRHLLEMIDDILDLSKFEMTGFVLRTEITQIAPLISEAIEITNDLFRTRRIRVSVDIEDDLPLLDIDKTRIRQVLINLLKNAQSFVEVSEVALTATRKDGEVVISIHDNGPGIPEEKLPHIFEEFYQADHARKRSYEGAGLGLTISERFVREHNGRIWAESVPGMGTTFIFTLPIPGKFLTMSSELSADLLRMERSTPKPCILLAESDSSALSHLQRLNEEYEIVPVRDNRDLQRMVEEHNPRGIVVNTQYNDVSHRDLRISSEIPVIECSICRSDRLSNGERVDGLLTKPVSAERLVEEIERLENKRGQISKLLIIDDDRAFCQLVERVLLSSRPESKLSKAYDAKRGLELARQERPDLLLLDLVMPDFGGMEVLHRLRQSYDLATTPVLVLTATSSSEEVIPLKTQQVVVRQSGGMTESEQLRYVHALLGVLEPRHIE